MEKKQHLSKDATIQKHAFVITSCSRSCAVVIVEHDAMPVSRFSSGATFFKHLPGKVPSTPLKNLLNTLVMADQSPWEIRAQSGLTMWQWWIVKEPLIKPWLPLVNAGFRFGANDFANNLQIAVLPHLFVDNASLLDGLDFENLSWSQFPTCRDPTKIDDFSEPTTTQMSYTNACAAFCHYTHHTFAILLFR